MWDYIHFSRYLDGRASEGYALTAVEKYVYDQVNQRLKIQYFER